jgi:hypothetical protein
MPTTGPVWRLKRGSTIPEDIILFRDALYGCGQSGHIQKYFSGYAEHWSWLPDVAMAKDDFTKVCVCSLVL